MVLKQGEFGSAASAPICKHNNLRNFPSCKHGDGMILFIGSMDGSRGSKSDSDDSYEDITAVAGLGTSQALQITAFAGFGVFQMLKVAPFAGLGTSPMLQVTVSARFGTLKCRKLPHFKKNQKKTTGPEDHGVTTGPEDHRTTGPEPHQTEPRPATKNHGPAESEQPK